jgi:hypothetical protein
MSYTIYYANPDIANELVYVTCPGSSFQRLCALIDNKHLLNFNLGEISTFPSKDCSISYRVSIQDIVKQQK